MFVNPKDRFSRVDPHDANKWLRYKTPLIVDHVIAVKSTWWQFNCHWSRCNLATALKAMFDSERSVTCLTAVASSISAWCITFVETDHEIISTAIILPSADSRRAVVSYKRKYVHNVLGNCLVKLAQEKSVDRRIDLLNMTIAVNWDVKHKIKPKLIRRIFTTSRLIYTTREILASYCISWKVSVSLHQNRWQFNCHLFWC